MSAVDFRYLPGRKKEGLLTFAEGIFDVFITFDVSDSKRRKLSGHQTAVIALTEKSNRLEDLGPLGGKILEALRTIEPGQIIHVAG